MSALRILFNLQPGEAKKTQLFTLLGLLWSFGTYGMFTLSEGTFLEHVGSAALPSCYVVIACGLCVISAIMLFLLNRIAIRHLLAGIITVWSATLFTFYALYTFTSLAESTAFWFAFRVMGWIIPISSYITFWAFIDQYFDLQDGKRFFSFFNSFLLLGDFLAAAVIAYTVQFVGEGILMLLYGVATLSALPFVVQIARTTPPVLDEHLDHLDSPPPLTLKSALTAIAKSRFTLSLIFFYLVMQLLYVVTEFNYMSNFEKHFSAEAGNKLTSFVGACSMWISLGNMVLGFVAYSRLVKRIGVNNIVVLAPTVLLTLFCFWFWKDGLSIAIFAMVAREGMSYVIDDNNLNLLLSGVPTKIKNQIRVTVESFVEPAGMLAASLLLLVFHSYGLYLGTGVAIAAFLVVLFLRHYYPKAIFQNLVATSIRFGKKAIEWIPKKERLDVEFRLFAQLKLPHEKSQLLAFEYLLKLEEPKVLGRLLNHVNLLTLPGKLRAIELLSESFAAKEGVVVERLERWRRQLPYPAIQSAIHFYFARHGLFRPERILHDLHNENLGLRAAAILTLKTTPFSHQLPSFCSLAEEKLQELLHSKVECEVKAGVEILGFEGKGEHVETLFPYLRHSSLLVRRTAAEAIRRVAEPNWREYGVKLASRLCYTHDSKTRLSCLAAIRKFANPDAVVPLIHSSIHFRPAEKKIVEEFAIKHGNDETLLRLVRQSTKHERCRLLSGKALAKREPQLLRENLYAIINQEQGRAYFYFFHAHTIQKQIPQQDLSILADALLTGYHSVVDFMIQLIGAANQIDECEVLAQTLWSKNRKIRAQAVETLEKTAPPRLFHILLPLINEEATEMRVRNFLKQGGTPLSLTQLLDAMAQSPSPTDRIVSAGLKAKLNMPNWEEQWQINKEEIFQHEELLTR